MNDSLWGEEFSVKSTPVETKKIIEKVKTPKKVVTRKKSTSSQSDTLSTLENIKQEVLRILGVYREKTVVIKTKEQLHDYITKAIENNMIAVDTETNNSLDPITCKLMGPCIYTPGEKNAYIPINHVDPITRERLSWQLTEDDIKEEFSRFAGKTYTLMHNGKFDYEVIKCTTGLEILPDWDTMIAAIILNENERASLKEQYITKIDPSIEHYSIEHLFEKMEYAIVDPDIFALYAATDAFMTYCLYEEQKKIFSLPENSKLYSLFMNVEMPVVKVTAEMELYGVDIDKEYASRLSTKYHKQVDEVDKKISEVLQSYKPQIDEWRKTKDANFHPTSKKPNKDGVYTSQKSKSEQLSDPPEITSPTQLAILLYDVLQTPVIDKKTPRGTGEDIIAKIDNPICALVLEKRGLEKLIGTYIDKLPTCVSTKDGRLHAQFNQLGAGTGRFSCVARDTHISMPGGDKLVQNVTPGDYVYCYDNDTNKLKLSKVKHRWFTGIRECVRLKWVSKYNKSLKGELICTPDHFIKTSNRGWVMAKDLSPQDSILYVHRRCDSNSVAVYGSFGQSNEEEHALIKDIYFHKLGNEFHVHHVDGNRLNNDPTNLNIVSPKAHVNAHLASNLPSSEHYCGKVNYSYNELISMGEEVNWELTKIKHDYSCVLEWYQKQRINYILKYTESYSKRSYTHNGRGAYKYLHLPLVKSNLKYALDLANGDTVLASTYFAVNEDEFIAACHKYQLLDNHNIVSIEYLDDLYEVYDLEVEGYHNFIANELCVHNCSNPNLQNIPSHNKEIRLMFKSSDGHLFVGCDFSQQEPRLLSEYSADETMIDAYKNGRDLYATIAKGVYKNDYWDNMEHREDGSPNPEGKKRRSNCKSILLGQHIRPRLNLINVITQRCN